MTAKFRKHIPALVKDVAPKILYPISVGQRCSHRIPKERVVGQCHAAAFGKGKAEPQRHLVGSKYTTRECMNSLEKAVSSYQDQLM